MMARSVWLASAAALGLAGAELGVFGHGLATAQDAPESLLPPGFDDPAPAPSPAPAPTPSALPAVPAAPVNPGSEPGVAAPVAPGSPSAPVPLPAIPDISGDDLVGIPSVEELEELSPEELDERLGLKPKFDIPPAARRSLSQVGVIARSEGGLPSASLANQPAGLVRAILAGIEGRMVSRWGHILLRRALASRLAAPEGMDPVEFAALRVSVLNTMGEFPIARAIAQDIDTGNWNTDLTNEALSAYIGASDILGVCPAVQLQGSVREDPQWVMMQAICSAYAGETALAGSQLDKALSEEIAPDVDILLAQRFAGAAGRSRRGVTIEWDGVDTISPWRFVLANAVGEEIPDRLMPDTINGKQRAYYGVVAATTPSMTLADREPYARVAARQGVFSARAMVDLYSDIYAANTNSGEAVSRAGFLRDAYLAANVEDRIRAMQQLWGEDRDFAGHVTTAYAAARIPGSAELAGYSADLIASMLTAGLVSDASAWRDVIAPGSKGWALLAVGTEAISSADLEAIETFVSNDSSDDQRASAFLIAGLAGLDRLSDAGQDQLTDDLDMELDRPTNWARTIEKAAQVDNAALVVYLAGLGMQGQDWSQMTPLHLYHIVSALRRVGLEEEARMIAAEAVARA